MQVRLLTGIVYLLACHIATASETDRDSNKGTSSVIRTFPLEGAHIWQTALTDSTIAFVLHKRDSSVVCVFGLDGQLRFRWAQSDSVNTQIQYVSLCRRASSLIVCQLRGIESYVSRVFTTGGSALFSVSGQGGLLSSPDGRYFAATAPADAFEPFRIYNRTGQITLEHTAWGLCGWTCAFIDDSLLALVPNGSDTITCIDARNGKTLWNSVLNLQEDQSPVAVQVSLDPPAILLNNSDGACAVDFDGQQLWNRQFDGKLRALVVDPIRQRLIAQLFDIKGGYGLMWAIAITDGSDSSEPLRLAREETVSALGANHFHFLDDLLLLHGPTNTSPVIRYHWKEFWTSFFLYDDEQMQFRRLGRRLGRYYPIRMDGNGSAYLHVAPAGEASIVTLSDSEIAE
ncbi:MAG TPA: hypothetical protein VGB22_00335 [candidate division Zixibacteria bacterium]|jgi:hypothetical protein